MHHAIQMVINNWRPTSKQSEIGHTHSCAQVVFEENKRKIYITTLLFQAYFEYPVSPTKETKIFEKLKQYKYIAFSFK